MKIHPEMREALNKAMEDGLKWWKKTTPEEIKRRFDQKVLNEQAPLRNKNPLTWRRVFTCTCFDFWSAHAPWCEDKGQIVFESELPKKEIDPTVINGRNWYFGHSSWGGMP